MRVASAAASALLAHDYDSTHSFIQTSQSDNTGLDPSRGVPHKTEGL